MRRFIITGPAGAATRGSRDTEHIATDRPVERTLQKSGVAGLERQHQGSKPRTVTPAVQAKVLRKTTQPPANGNTHWSCRKLAATLGLGKSTVQRIWSLSGINRTGWSATWER